MSVRPRGASHDAALAILGFVLGVVARIWLATLRVRVASHPELENVIARPWVYAFWHGTLWPLLAWKRRRPSVVMVSLSRDGSIQSRALALQGMTVVRGSTSRGERVGSRRWSGSCDAQSPTQLSPSTDLAGPVGSSRVGRSPRRGRVAESSYP